MKGRDGRTERKTERERGKNEAILVRILRGLSENRRGERIKEIVLIIPGRRRLDVEKRKLLKCRRIFSEL